MISIEVLEKFKKKLKNKTTDDRNIIFVSTSNGETRADVWKTSGSTFDRSWQKVERYLQKMTIIPQYIKIDLVTSIEAMKYEKLLQDIKNVSRNNYFRKGVSFDSEFKIAFLEQEINGTAMLIPSKDHIVGKNNPNMNWNDNNVLRYLQAQKGKVVLFDSQKYHGKEVYEFETTALFYDGKELYELSSEEQDNGVRKVSSTKYKKELRDVIVNGSQYLYRQINDDGRFVYGYFPTYAHVLTSYNTIRHFSSLYALLETIRINKNKDWLDKIKQSLEYGIKNLSKEVNGKVVLVENDEVKLGANAMGILALVEYQKVSGDDSFTEILEKMVAGLRLFIDDKGDTVHVLNAKDLSVKEEFRIVYYDGEALFSLMRYYGLTKRDEDLELAKLMMNNMIAKKYEEHHDHWLSYAVNELTQYVDDVNYYDFGIRNFRNNLDFIQKRDTAYPTMLELLVAAEKMTKRIEDKKIKVTEEYDSSVLKEVTNYRAHHEINVGTFLPEVAMYMKMPQLIMNGFYARHDRFRARIDDAEHFLSGLINYYELEYLKK